MRNGFLRGKKVQKEAAPVKRRKRWSGRIGWDGRMERQRECLKIKSFLAQSHITDVIFYG